MKRIFLIGGIVFLVLLAAMLVVPFLVPNSVYKAQIEKAATNALGRDVTVAGDVSISVFPGISASVADVAVSNPEGFAEENMITAGALKGSVRLVPLISRRVEVSELEFVDANVRLTRLEDGRVNWMFGSEATAEPDAETPSGGSFSTAIDRFSLKNASLSYSDEQTGAAYQVKALDAETGFRSLEDTVSLKARGLFQEQPISIDMRLTTPQDYIDGDNASLIFELSSDLARASYEGSIANAEELSLDGRFNVSAPQIGELASFLDLEMGMNLEPLGGLQATGEIIGPLSTAALTFEKLELKAEGLSASYTGALTAGSDIMADGRTQLSVRNLNALLTEIGYPIQQLAPLNQVTLSSRISGALTEPELSNLDVKTSGPNLETSYKGDLSLAGAGRINGDVNIQSSQLRAVLTQLGVDLPEGDTIKTAKLQGKASGTLNNILVSDGRYEFDQTKATGSIGADLSGQKPKIIADLKTETLDLSPFLGTSQKSGAQSSGWSDAPLDLKGLTLVDADIALAADLISLGAVQLTDSVLDAKLQNGQLRANLKRFNAFGGAWRGAMSVDAAQAVPAFGFNMNADTVSANSLLSTLASFDRLTGTGGVSIDLTANGSTLAQIVNQLNGELQLDLSDGALRGINLGQLVRTAGSLSEKLAAGDLTLASLGSVVSPQAETDFTAFNASLDIENGIGQLSQLKLANSVLNVDGTGQINLGGRTLDVRLAPGIDRTGSGAESTVQLNGIPIPLRISGSWTSPSFAPDFSGVRAALQQELRDRAVDRVKDRLDGELGAIVSGALGGDRSNQTATEAETPSSEDGETAEDTVAEEPEDDRDPGEKLLEDALGSIFGPN